MDSASGPRHYSGGRNLLALGALALAGSLWGTGFLFGKIAMSEMSVSENVSFRFIVGALALSPILLRGWDYRARELGLILFASLIGIPIQFLIQFQGLELTTASHASLIVGTLPVMLAISSAAVLKERLQGLEWGGLGLSAAGALLIARSSATGSSGPQPSMRGDLLVLLSLCAAVVMILCTKRLIATHNPLHVTATLISIGTIMLLVWVELTEPVRVHFSAVAWCAAAAQGLLATAGAYLCWNWGLSHMQASRAGVFLNLEPAVGALLGVIFLRERLGPMALLGGFFILSAAVYYSVRPHPGQGRGIKTAMPDGESE